MTWWKQRCVLGITLVSSLEISLSFLASSNMRIWWRTGLYEGEDLYQRVAHHLDLHLIFWRAIDLPRDTTTIHCDARRAWWKRERLQKLGWFKICVFTTKSYPFLGADFLRVGKMGLLCPFSLLVRFFLQHFFLNTSDCCILSWNISYFVQGQLDWLLFVSSMLASCSKRRMMLELPFLCCCCYWCCRYCHLGLRCCCYWC